METLRKRLEEQKERHQGATNWVGNGGHFAFRRNMAYTPEGLRMARMNRANQRAVKVWDKNANSKEPRHSV